MSLSSILLFAGLAAAAALPAPNNPQSARDISPTLINRQATPTSIWSAPSGVGNLVGKFSDATIQLGCSPDTVMQSVADNCDAQGDCVPSWTIPCGDDQGATTDFTITINEGDYAPWIHNGLIDAQLAALKAPKVVTSETVTAMHPSGCSECGMSRRHESSNKPEVLTNV